MRRLGITGKLVFHSVWILVGLGTGFTLYFVKQLWDLRYQDTVRRVEAQTLNWIEANDQIMFLLEAPPKYERESGQGIDYEVLDAKVSELAKKEWIAYVILLDAGSRIRATTAIPDGLTEEGPPSEVSGVKVTGRKDTQRRRYFELSIPISASGTGMNPDLGAMFATTAHQPVLGEVRIGVDRKQFERHLATLVRRTVSLSVALVALAAVASFVFARQIVRPITLIGRVANRIAGGDLSARVQHSLQMKDEVGDLVRNFNQMARRLESLHSGLEDEVKQRTFELEGANQKLRELDKLKSYFVSIVSHDLRTALTSIKAFAEILSDERNPDPGKRKHYLEIINKESDRMTRLISDLLRLEKINSGTFDWRMGRTNLEEIIRESEELMIPQAKEKGIELHVTELHCPPVWGDPDCLERVVTNLIGNAIKFCPAGGRVEVRPEQVPTSGPQNGLQGSYVRVVVADNGPGIPQEDQKRLFEPFYQPPKHSRVGSGVGLGLAICREIVSHHKGEIWVESELGAGSRLSFTVPLYQSALSSGLANQASG